MWSSSSHLERNVAVFVSTVDLGTRVAQQQINHFQASTSNREVERSISVLTLSLQGQILLRQKELEKRLRIHGPPLGGAIIQRQMVW
jgi:hypothetical protein